jgi:CBS domain-containing protein
MRRLQKTITEIGWTRDVPQLTRDARVADALVLMQREAHDCVLVVDAARADAARVDAARAGESTLVGIFTTRDFLNRVAAKRIDPGSLALGDVMTPSPRTLAPHDPVAFAINWMAIEGFRNVPIVEGGGEGAVGRVLGVLTIWDVMRQLGEVFAELEATPRPIRMQDEISAVVALTDVGGDG